MLLGKSPTIYLGQSYYLCIIVPQESRNRPSGLFENGLLIYTWIWILKYILWICSKSVYPWQLFPAVTSHGICQGIFDLFLSATLFAWYSLLSYFICFSPQTFTDFLFFRLLWATASLWAPKIIRCSVSFLVETMEGKGLWSKSSHWGTLPKVAKLWQQKWQQSRGREDIPFSPPPPPWAGKQELLMSGTSDAAWAGTSVMVIYTWFLLMGNPLSEVWQLWQKFHTNKELSRSLAARSAWAWHSYQMAAETTAVFSATR